MTGKPTIRNQVLDILKSLRSGEISREDASNWAVHIMEAEHSIHADPKAWKVITAIGGADSISTDRPYLYEDVDFAAWEESLSSDEV